MSDRLEQNYRKTPPEQSNYESRRLEAIRIAEYVTAALLTKLRGDPGNIFVELTIATLGRLEKIL